MYRSSFYIKYVLLFKNDRRLVFAHKKKLVDESFNFCVSTVCTVHRFFNEVSFKIRDPVYFLKNEVLPPKRNKSSYIIADINKKNGRKHKSL